MKDLNANIILQRIPSLILDIDSNNNINIHLDQKVTHCGPHGLTILDMFYQPTSLKEASSKLQARIKGTQDGMDLMAAITHLYEAGILRDGSQNKPTFETEMFGFDSATLHIAMLNDKIRTLHYLDGIREVIQEGDIVVDVGTGLGILAIAAIRAGAQHVYAVEASGIGKSAKAIFEANGLADRITIIEGWSTQVSLPEPADVLISEIIGNEPLAENVLEITNDAMKRLLKPDARLIPNKVKIFGLPVTVPKEESAKYIFTEEILQNWQSWYKIDFSPLIEASRKTHQIIRINPFSVQGWKFLSQPVLMADIDFKNISNLTIDNKITVTANNSGQLNGLLEYFEIELGPMTRLSIHPHHVDEANHWQSLVWIFNDPWLVQTGDQFTVTYQYRKTEDCTKVSVSRI